MLGDDLNSDRVRVDGGELLASEYASEEQGGDRVYRLRYTIAAYRVDTAELRVRPIPVRYYTRLGNVLA